MTFQEIVSAGQSAVSVLSNPKKSSLAASGFAGVFSAEANNLRKQALSYLPGISAKLGPSYQSVVDSLLSPIKNILGGSPDSSIPDNPSGTILGFTYLQAIMIGAAALLVGIFMIGRGSR